MKIDYTSYQSVEVTDSQDNYKELVFAIDLKMTAAGRPAYISGPPEDCYPAEGAEFEVVQVGIDNPKVKTVWTYDEFYEFIGSDIAEKVIEEAHIDADENFDGHNYEPEYEKGDFM